MATFRRLPPGAEFDDAALARAGPQATALALSGACSSGDGAQNVRHEQPGSLPASWSAGFAPLPPMAVAAAATTRA